MPVVSYKALALVLVYVWVIAILAFVMFIVPEFAVAPLSHSERVAMVLTAVLATVAGAATAAFLLRPIHHARLAPMFHRNGVYLSGVSALGFLVLAWISEFVGLWPFVLWFLPGTIACAIMFLVSPRWQRHDG
jgi:hypothetical protein